jgi:hypothetical protein
MKKAEKTEATRHLIRQFQNHKFEIESREGNFPWFMYHIMLKKEA